MDRLSFVLESVDENGYVFNRTTKEVEDRDILWTDATRTFYDFLRGHGYIIVAEEFANYVNSVVVEIADAEKADKEPMQLSLPLDEV
jgi:hypothetical protein